MNVTPQPKDDPVTGKPPKPPQSGTRTQESRSKQISAGPRAPDNRLAAARIIFRLNNYSAAKANIIIINNDRLSRRDSTLRLSKFQNYLV